MTQTIERPRQAHERQGELRLDLNKVGTPEYSPDTSRIALQVAEPTAEKPFTEYAVSPKSQNHDTDPIIPSRFTVNESGEVNWKVDSSPEGVGFIYVRDGYSPQILGAEDRMDQGTFTIEPGASVIAMPYRAIGEHIENDFLTNEGLEATIADPDLNMEAIRWLFDEALSESIPSTAEKAARNMAARAQRREAKRLKEVQDQRAASNTSSTEGVRVTTDSSPAGMPTVIPTPGSIREAFAQRKNDARQQNRAKQPVAEQVTGSSDPLTSATNTEPAYEMDDEERQYLEDQRRGFKVINKRRRSRDELLNTPEDILNADIRRELLKKTAEEETAILPVSDTEQVAAEESSDSAQQASANEKEPIVSKRPTPPFEKIDYNPNDDPAIENGLAQLDALREEMASLTANRHNRLFSLPSKKSKEVTSAYNQQLITLGQFVTSDMLRGDTLTESQKNVAVMKFLVNEQAALQGSTYDKLQGTKASKFVEWMNIHGKAVDATVDVQNVVQSIEQATTDDDKVRLAQEHLANLYKKQVRGEQHERRKEAARVVAIGVVGMAAAAFGINPSAPVDAANNMFYGARKK
ncbi:MAG: hypothetical protein JWM07_844 [Candidatus Saccharibacteria bacterium]|nr:hypothetical protein [Candidatus Saccharibacteria bacterium]